MYLQITPILDSERKRTIKNKNDLIIPFISCYQTILDLLRLWLFSLFDLITPSAISIYLHQQWFQLFPFRFCLKSKTFYLDILRASSTISSSRPTPIVNESTNKQPSIQAHRKLIYYWIYCVCLWSQSNNDGSLIHSFSSVFNLNKPKEYWDSNEGKKSNSEFADLIEFASWEPSGAVGIVVVDVHCLEVFVGFICLVFVLFERIIKNLDINNKVQDIVFVRS